MKCFYFRGTCVNDDATCAVVPSVGATTADKKSYCEIISITETCTYIAGSFCVKVAATCDAFDVTASTDKAATCGSLKDGSAK